MDRKNSKRNLMEFGDTRIPPKKSLVERGITLDRRLYYSTHVKRRMGLAFHHHDKLYSLQKPVKTMRLWNRIELLKSVILPTALYGQELWSRASTSDIITSEGRYHRLCRQTLGIPWYARNEDFKKYFGLSHLREQIQTARENIIQCLSSIL